MIVADTHVHLYPCYDAAAAIGALVANLGAALPDRIAAACLTEARGCRLFEAVAGGRANLGRWGIEPTPDREAVAVTDGGRSVLYLFAGRQVVTAEKVEILGLTLTEDIGHDQPASEVVEAVLARGAVPVLSWAPGKWWGRRGDCVRRLIEREEAGRLLLGDTSLRPLGWPEPLLMRRGRRVGLKVVAGSDALPFAGEERCMGVYHTELSAALDPARPVESLRTALRSTEVEAARAGRRCGPLEVLRRLRRHSKARRGT